jgi:DNA invertase Pin-like site-specific DNA recombinase
MAKPKKAIAYGRYSSERQSARSISDQFELCRKIAKQNGYDIIEYYKDEAVSGAGTLGRAGWMALMRAVAGKDRTFDAVIIESLSRMSRDLADSARDFKRIAHRQVELIDLEGPLNTMRVGMSGIMNQEFRKHLGNMLRRAWDGRVKEGLMPGKPAFGHRKVPGTSFEREIDPDQAEIVKRIFTEYANLEPPREIAARLNAEGIPSPSGGKWNHQVFIAGGGNAKGMIGNRIYIGELFWNNHRSVINPETEKRNKQKGKAEDLLSVSVPHLRIIDQELWDRAQRVRTERSRQTPGKIYKKTIVRHMLAGRLQCGECGGNMKIVWSSPGEKTRVGCTNARERGICSNKKSYGLADIEATVLHGIKHNLDVEALTAFTEGAHKEWSARQGASRADHDKVQRDLNRTLEKIDRIVTAMTDPDMPLAPLKDKLKALELERAGLDNRLRMIKADGGDNVVTLHPTMIQRFRKNLESMVEALSNTKLTEADVAPFRVAFGNVFDRVVVHKVGKRKPVEVTPYARVSAIMGVDIVPKMRAPEKVLEDQGLTNLVLATHGTLEQLSW